MSTTADSLPISGTIAPTPQPLFWMALGGACVLHVLLLWLLGASQPHPDRPLDKPFPRLQWRWVPPSTSDQPAVKPAHSKAEPPEPKDNQQARKTVRDVDQGRLPTAPNTNGDANASSSAGDTSVQAESSTDTPFQAPLQLQLPTARPGEPRPTSVRGLALNDARSNSRASSLEDRIAQATTGNDALQVDNLGDGRKRVRMNGRCVDVHQARISQIDAMNEVSARAMPGLKTCD